MAPPQWPPQAIPPNETTTTPRATARWWNPWYTVFAVFLSAYAGYVIFVFGRTSHGLTDAAPRPWNAITLTALSLGSILSYQAAGRLNRRRSDASWQTAVLAAIHTAANRPTRSDDEPTVPVVGRGVVYAAAMHGTLPGYASLTEALKQWVDDRVDGRIDGALADVRRLSEVNHEMDTPAGGWREKVTQMPPGRR